jgi:uncharacterized protein YndB with AHSA1/START domain
MESTWATLDTADNRPVLRFERRLAHPPEKVWKAITDPSEMAHWFPATVRTELRIGAPMRFSFEGRLDVDPFFEEGEIIEFDSPRVYAFRWNDSLLRFELVPEASGCRLVFTHTLGGSGTWGDRASAARHAAGWDGCLAVLAARVDGRTPPPMAGPWWFERAERYIESFGLAEGEVRPDGDGYLVRFERDLVQSVETVWAALLEGHQDELAIGKPPPLRPTNTYVPAGLVTEVDPPHSVEYTVLHEDAPVGRVRFDLNKQVPIGCRLVVTQTLPARLAGLRATVLAAWQTHLELLFAALHGDVRCPWPTERTSTLEKHYADRLD